MRRALVIVNAHEGFASTTAKPEKHHIDTNIDKINKTIEFGGSRGWLIIASSTLLNGKPAPRLVVVGREIETQEAKDGFKLLGRLRAIKADCVFKSQKDEKVEVPTIFLAKNTDGLNLRAFLKEKNVDEVLIVGFDVKDASIQSSKIGFKTNLILDCAVSDKIPADKWREDVRAMRNAGVSLTCIDEISSLLPRKSFRD